MADQMKRTLPHQMASRTVPTDEDLGSRVFALESSVDSIAEDMTEVRASLTNVVTKDEMAGLRQDVRGLTMQLQTQTKTQWPVIWSGLGVLLAVLVALGTLAYMPIQQGQTANQSAIAALRAEQVGLSEYDARREQVDRRLDVVEDRLYESLLRELARADQGP